MGFSDSLREGASATWERIFSHPFVAGIGDGTLPVDKFRFYVRQDYVFLVEYARALSLGVVKASTLERMTLFSDLAQATLHDEMSLHRAYADSFGLTPRDLEDTTPAPTTYAYTRHILHAGLAGSEGELLAALLPCMWTYPEIGRRLAPNLPAVREREPLYAKWIEAYAEPEFADLAARIRAQLDACAADAGAAERERVRRNFDLSSKYELLFWEMGLTAEQWPA